MRPHVALVVAALLTATACSSGSSASVPGVSSSPADSESPSPTTSPTSAASVVEGSTDPLAAPTIQGRFALADGRNLALECWGEGSPTVVLVGGHPSDGIRDFDDSPFARFLAQETRTCAYARSGYLGSDPAPNEPRDADDVIGELNELLAVAEVDGPFVLVGSSFGGMIVTYYAARYPEDVVGVVMLDVPPPSATLTLAEIPELAWDHPANPERVDVIPEFETRFANERLPITAPITVITATDGQSSVEEQRIWLEISDNATQIELEGGHDIYFNAPTACADEVIKLVEAAR